MRSCFSDALSGYNLHLISPIDRFFGMELKYCMFTRMTTWEGPLHFASVDFFLDPNQWDYRYNHYHNDVKPSVCGFLT